MKSIVIFYSLDGNTRKAAQTIAANLNADILELEPVQNIPGSGFRKFFIGGYQAVFGICPPLKPLKFQPDRYDRIILGTPVWAGKCAPAINSFLKNYSVNDKIKAVFTSSGGGDNHGCLTKLEKRLHNLKWSLALADQSNPTSSENDTKLKHFVEGLQNGK